MKNIKARYRKFLSLFLSLVMVTGMLPVTAFEARADVNVCKNLTTEVEYSTVQAAVAAVQANETIQMIADVDLTETIAISNAKNFTLDLNGHKLNGQNNIRVIVNKGSLTINDSSNPSSGKITGGKGDASSCGGGIYNEGTLTLNGGTISENTGYYGAGVGNFSNGTFTMNGGTISGNTADSDGGGVYNFTSSNTFIMNGGTISGNTATSTGGGICINGGTFNMEKGTVSENKAGSYGAGVKNSGTFHMTGGTITGNTLTGSTPTSTYGGGVYSSGKLTMTGGEITGNTGHGIFCSSNGSSPTLGGSAKISGNTHDGVTNNLFLPTGKTISISTELTKGADIGVRASNPPTSITDNTANSGDAKYFHSDDTNYAVVFNTDHLELVSAYTVTFDVGDHGTAPMPEKVVSGGKVTKPTDPTETDYTFLGWYKEDTCTTAWDFDNDTVTAATTLYAKWIAGTYHWTTLPSNAYKVTLDNENLSKEDAIAIAENNIGTPTEEIYVIHYWYDKATGKYGAARAKNGQWKEEPSSAALRVFRKSSVPVYIIGTVDKTFDWTSLTKNTTAITFTDDAMTSSDAKAIADQMTATSTKKTNDFVAYAAGSDANTYKVLVYNASNEWEENNASLAVLRAFLTRGNSVYVIGTITELTTYTVSCASAEHGTVSATPTTAAQGAEITVTAAPDSGYVLDTLTYTPDGSSTPVTITGNKFTMPGADVEVKATFKEKTASEFTVTFDANGGTGSMVSMTTSGQKLTLPENDFTAPEGKQFAGWGIGSRTGDAVAPGEELTFDEDTTVYALWEDEAVIYNRVTFRLGGKGKDFTVAVASGSCARKPAAPTYRGWTFVRWCKDSLKKLKFDFSTPITEDTEIYAKWSRNDSSDDDNSSTAMPSKPVKTGTWDDPVTDGTWSMGSNGKWMYKTNADFRDTWGYIRYTDRNGIEHSGWFWFDASGYMVTGWVKIGGSWFYFDETEGGTLGMMKQGWIIWNGNRYYLAESKDGNGGKMLAGTTTPDGREVDETGKMIR